MRAGSSKRLRRGHLSSARRGARDPRNAVRAGLRRDLWQDAAAVTASAAIRSSAGMITSRSAVACAGAAAVGQLQTPLGGGECGFRFGASRRFAAARGQDRSRAEHPRDRLNEAARRGIPVTRLGIGSLIFQLGYGKYARRVQIVPDGFSRAAWRWTRPATSS